MSGGGAILMPPFKKVGGISPLALPAYAEGCTLPPNTTVSIANSLHLDNDGSLKHHLSLLVLQSAKFKSAVLFHSSATLEIFCIKYCNHIWSFRTKYDRTKYDMTGRTVHFNEKSPVHGPSHSQ